MIDQPIRITSASMTNDPSSEIIFIQNLMRPFTIPQLKTLLRSYGKLVDDEFWLDKLRSQCLVKVSTMIL
jgi:apoptotic chromatin condensation inducer in the nucleus